MIFFWLLFNITGYYNDYTVCNLSEQMFKDKKLRFLVFAREEYFSVKQFSDFPVSRAI